ncbi:alpha-protein kinase vwkA isoform X1 [Daphnia magna]|uniref:alpha-protein kinase vwkA isoform X1 n=2 Tax=Daphnia magna TaxID=35525 RepID=UPI0014038198|nr:alpha-protein kinase vwkA isoform X1 [Daphnia magna]
MNVVYLRSPLAKGENTSRSVTFETPNQRYQVVTMSDFARQNKATDAKIDTTTIFASGAFKIVYKGKYTKGERAGEECVCKIFKSESVFEESYFQEELKVVAKALEIVNMFNRDKHINQKILLNEPDVWTFTSGNKKGKKALIEPMITNFEKFNSNSGWTPKESSPWINAMQALSHFSYHTSNRRALLCDLQGGVYKDGFVLTDPVIISTNQEYGPTDLGVEGISTFFASHRCNQYCKVQWLVPHDKKKHFNVQKSTAMVLPNRQSRAALTCQLPG